jgi:hypothetical protein
MVTNLHGQLAEDQFRLKNFYCLPFFHYRIHFKRFSEHSRAHPCTLWKGRDFEVKSGNQGSTLSGEMQFVMFDKGSGIHGVKDSITSLMITLTGGERGVDMVDGGGIVNYEAS